MNKVYLLIGGNIGDRMANLAMAVQFIEKYLGKMLQISSIYETAAWGNTHQADFLNQSICIETPLTPTDLMTQILLIEKAMGRERNIPIGPRTIDIDILYYNDAIVENEQVTIPHPRISERKFVLYPLVEIAPEWMHPILHKTNTVLLKECGDSLTVHKKTI
jgi:2-amino-4-hydroxy-6-hydroxymethyldihydropteridine diphosphokinase